MPSSPSELRRRAAVAAAVVGVVVGLAACGGGGGGERAAVDARAGTTAASAPTPVTDVVASRPTSPVDGLFGVGDAQQVIAVVADEEGDATATLTAYELEGGVWVEKFGPWSADIGSAGFAPPDAKREGDNRTPAGSYGFDFAFGILADPGAQLPYRRVTSEAIVWDDDPSSPHYNEWVDTSVRSAGDDPEPMYNEPVYDYGVVIDYNPDRTPGLGSAIFLHVTRDGPTAGCVAVSKERMVDLLRWLNPAKQPRIVMGTRAALAP